MSGITLHHPEIPSHERLIFALDVDTLDSARDWVERLGDSVHFYKIGLELLASGDYFTLLAQLRAAGKRVFADLKLHDIPATVAAAVAALARHQPDLLTLHAYPDAIRAAAPLAGSSKLLAVTVLTSMDQTSLAESGVSMPIDEAVSLRARGALSAGAHGLVCSGLEVRRLRSELGSTPLIVCPGIRAQATGDDQQRTVSVNQAFEYGADYIVIGRPIRQAPNPRAAAEAIQRSIAEVFA